MSRVTQILSDLEQGQPSAAAELLPLVYEELRTLAAARIAQERPGQTLQATALVHEAYLRLLGEVGQCRQFKNRAHFFAAAAEAMRRILIDIARRKSTVKHGGQHERLELQADSAFVLDRPEEALAINEALDRLAAEDEQAATLVKLHYFGGFTLQESGELLGLSRATVFRTWAYARAWLKSALA